jgi:putative membrane-bound dehydrogenase-like protein
MPTARAMLAWMTYLVALSAAARAAAAPPTTRPADATLAVPTPSVDANRLAYLDDPADPYYVGCLFPKLITPQWVGEPGVDAVVVLAIDDMRDPAKYERWLRPVLDRLKRIDGRAPVSIMTNRVDPANPQLQAWLKEGLSLDAHTYDHPCPILKDGDLAAAKRTYDQCVDLLAAVPGNRPVAFRTPCCDSRNTFSPRLVTEVIAKATDKGNFLTIDSSVFNVLTPNDPELPRPLVQNPDGSERFRRYLPFPNFVNTVDDYPYPYVIGNRVWEFPCVVPSDWEAQNVQKPFNPRTVDDWKAALDAIVVKKGVFTAVFHPHNWIKPEQLAEFVDYADKTYGRRVKFLTFRECQERLDKHLLAGQPIRDPKTGGDNGVRLLDLNGDGYLDVVVGNDAVRQTRIYSPALGQWLAVSFPASIAAGGKFGDLRFGCVGPRGEVGAVTCRPSGAAWLYDGDRWRNYPEFFDGLAPGDLSPTASLRLRDLDGDGRSDLIVRNTPNYRVYSRGPDARAWRRLGFDLPSQARFGNDPDWHAGTQFVDVDEDGRLDLLIADGGQRSLYLFASADKGWASAVFDRRGDELNGPKSIPPLGRDDGSHNGCFVRSRALWWLNEDTAKLPDLVEKRSFNDLLGDRQPGSKSPAASLRCLQPRPGFEVQLVAAEPLVQDPVAFAFGADGKLWVVEMGDYPLGADGRGKPGGRVKVLTDADGDGVYDKATVFLDGLQFPTGVTPWHNGVLVTAAPDILYAEDADGDGVADKREVLYTGFAEGNQQHRVNGLTMGLDNWFYGANGHSNGKIRSTKTGQEVDVRNRDFRVRPDTGQIEAATGVTQFGRARDDWGTWFGNDNSHPLYQFLLEEHYIRRNPHVVAPAGRVEVPDVPGAAPVFPISRTIARFNDLAMANHFTSANSSMIYRDDLFGPAFEGSAFVSEPVHNLVSRLVLRNDGLRVRGGRAPDEQDCEFLASSDGWCRPTMLRTGPDGALWVADMYRHVIEHPQWIPKDWQAKLDLRAGHDMGRIYRVFPVGTRPRPIPRLDQLTGEKLAAALDSPSGWQRDMVQQLLVERQDQSAVAALEKLARDCARPAARAQALCALDGLKAVTPELLAAALADAHPGVRRQAVRLAEPLMTGHPDLGKAVAALANDPDPHVRFQVACSLGEWADPAAGEALAAILTDAGDDPVLRAAAMSSLTPGNTAATLRAVGATSGETGKPPPSPALVGALARMAVAAKNAAGTLALVEAVTRIGPGGQFQDWQFLAHAALAAALDGREAYLSVPPADAGAAEAAERRLLAQVDAARAVAADPQVDASRRAAAAGLLGLWRVKWPQDQPVVAGLLEPAAPPELQAAAVAAVARSRRDDGPTVLLARWPTYAPALRGAVLDALTARSKWAAALLDAVAQGRVRPADVDAARRQALLAAKDAGLRDRAKALFADAVNPDRQKAIEAMRPALTLPGDAGRGQAVFARTCATCHAAAGTGTARAGNAEAGNAVGPDLASVGDRSPEGLLTAILDPNRAVEPRFVSYVVETRAGDTLSGLLAGESGAAITLLGPDGKTQQVLRADVRALRSTGLSLMPEGLESGLQPQDLADLIAFVRGVRPVPVRRVLDGNRPAVVMPDPAGTLRLAPAAAEVFGRAITLERPRGNLGYWTGEDDHAAWTCLPGRAGTYDVWVDYACDAKSGGNTAEVLVGSGDAPGGRLAWTVEPTGTWDAYRRVKVGRLTLAAGRQRVTVRPAGAVRGAMFDLRGVDLVPTRDP